MRVNDVIAADETGKVEGLGGGVEGGSAHPGVLTDGLGGDVLVAGEDDVRPDLVGYDVGLIVPLIMALIMFDNLNDREFSASLGRLCFLLICGALAVVTLSLKHAGIPLYLDKEGNGDNMVTDSCISYCRTA